ncbi:MAG: replication initiator protein A [Gemmatimonadota bacterium]|nr:replication initiator protein A [Gemmatimonadota bacterium]MDE3129045.1 replication initiator protein A [Gemmatimonadota bacterium]MDE3172457.1 replication initiator protein A [Gemmatimonadota bacterium]
MPAERRRRVAPRQVALDRSLEALPLFRLSDSPEDAPVAYTTDTGGRWRVLPAPGDRLPGTFDQDVYVELMRRFQEAGSPLDGAVSFTLHAFLHSMDRQVDGRTYEQLRTALVRLERTVLESAGAYRLAGEDVNLDGQFTVLSAVAIERRRAVDRGQLALFDATMAPEPGAARAVLAPIIRANLVARHQVTLSVPRYRALGSPVARRLYRLLEVARAENRLAWRVPLERLKEMLPLGQRYPSHLQRVLQPAHELLRAEGILRSAAIRQERRRWYVDYVLGSRTPGPAEGAEGAEGGGRQG